MLEFNYKIGGKMADVGVVSYNSDEMEHVRLSYKSQLEIVQDIKNNMEEDVQVIREKWEGTDAEAAYDDLEAIKTQIASVEGNIKEILSSTEKVMKDFGSLQYKGQRG